jgi:hypothetical protein
MTTEGQVNASGLAEPEGKSRPALAKLLYRRTSFEEYGERMVYEKALRMPTVNQASYINELGWRVSIDIRYDGIESYALISRRPLEEGNVYEEVEVWGENKFLPPEAFD